jgi:hypothetical protein
MSYPLTVKRFLKSSLSGYPDSGENLKVSTCNTSARNRTKKQSRMSGGDISRLYTRRSRISSRNASTVSTAYISKPLRIFFERIKKIRPLHNENYSSKSIIVLDKALIKLVSLYILAAFKKKINKKQELLYSLILQSGQFQTSEIELFINILNSLILNLTDKYQFKYNDKGMSLLKFVSNVYITKPLCHLYNYSSREILSVQYNLIQLVSVVFDDNSNIVSKLEGKKELLNNFFRTKERNSGNNLFSIFNLIM